MFLLLLSVDDHWSSTRGCRWARCQVLSTMYMSWCHEFTIENDLALPRWTQSSTASPTKGDYHVYRPKYQMQRVASGLF